jgi:two-component system response regulator RegA
MSSERLHLAEPGPRADTESGSRLLLVDDDEVFCSVLRRALQRRGFRVAVAHSPDAALELARDREPEFAVVDLRLGQSSGLVLVEQLAKQDPQMRILVLTGYASIATAVEAIKLGAVHYLTKPADADRILAAFERTEGDAEVPPPDSPPSPRRLEWEHLQKVLMDHDGNVSATARALGMHRRTLQRKLSKRPVKE